MTKDHTDTACSLGRLSYLLSICIFASSLGSRSYPVCAVGQARSSFSVGPPGRYKDRPSQNFCCSPCAVFLRRDRKITYYVVVLLRTVRTLLVLCCWGETDCRHQNHSLLLLVFWRCSFLSCHNSIYTTSTACHHNMPSNVWWLLVVSF